LKKFAPNRKDKKITHKKSKREPSPDAQLRRRKKWDDTIKKWKKKKPNTKYEEEEKQSEVPQYTEKFN